MKSTDLIQPLPMVSPIANQGAKFNIPQNPTSAGLASVVEGFPEITMQSLKAGGLPPRGQDANGMFYLSTDQKVYLQNGGIITFSQEVSDLIGGYPKNAILDYIDENNTYFKVQSLIDDNTNNFIENPELIDEINWKKVNFGSGASGSSLPIGFIGQSAFPIDETKGLQRSLNGSKLSINANTQGFLSILKAAGALYPSLLTESQEAWDNIKNNSDMGQCGKFFIDETAGYIQLPCVVKMQGCLNLATIGNIVDAGSPNITGSITSNMGGKSNPQGALTIGTRTAGSAYVGGGAGGKTDFGIDASLSNPIYGNSETVQEEAIQYPYFIQIATGATENVNIVNEIELNNPYSLMDFKYTPGPVYNLSWKQGGNTITKATHPALYNAILIENNPEIEVGTTSNIDGWQYTKRGWPEVKLSGASDITDYDVVLDETTESAILPLKAKVTYLDVSKTVPVVPADLTKTTPFTDGVNSYGFSTNGYASNTSRLFSSIDDSTATVGTTGTLKPSSNNIVGRIGDVDGYTNLVTNLSSLASNDFYLYWYVGETVQNANLIDVARIEETKANITQLDGPWQTVTRDSLLLSNVNLPQVGSSTILEFDISDFLPVDNNYYEISYLINLSTAATKNAETHVYLYGGAKQANNTIGISTNAAVAVVILNGNTAIIGPDRKLKIDYYNGTAAGKINDLWVGAYRRKGII